MKMPRVKNTEKKYSAESDNYVFCWATVDDEKVALMLTDNEYKSVRRSADKNLEDFPKVKTLLQTLLGWFN